jgi:hypothetical protein
MAEGSSRAKRRAAAKDDRRERPPPDAAGAPWRPAQPARSRAERLPAYVLLLLVLGLLAVFRARAANPLGVRSDSWTEANIYVSARNVGTNGWARYAGAAQHQVDRPPFVEDPFFRYAYYPLGTYYINWLLYDLGERSLAAWRWPPMLLSLVSLGLWYALLCRFVGRWVALLATAFLGLSNGFLDFADNIHHGYSNVLVVGMMLSFVAGVANSSRRWTLMATSWALVFINGFVSWEWYLWSQVFYWGYTVLLGVPFKRHWVLGFALAPLLAFAIQSHHRTVALGPQQGAGFTEDLLRRTIRLEEAVDTPTDVTLATYPLHVAGRFRAYYGIGVLPICGLALAWGVLVGGLRRSISRAHPVFRLVVVLFLCGVSWWCVMLQHTAVHPHVMRHAQLFCALVLGLVVAAAVQWVMDRGRPIWTRAAAAIVAGVVLWLFGTSSYANFRLHVDPSASPPWDVGWSESTELLDLARKLPADVILLTNNNRMPLMRFWTNLPVYGANLSWYPFRRDQIVPGSRPRLALSTSHLRDLYGDRLPRLVYVYFFRQRWDVTYAGDPTLQHLIDGTWGQRPPPARVANFKEVITRGQGQTAYPIVARSRDWIAFDARDLFPNLPAEWRALPPPTKVDFGPPR